MTFGRICTSTLSDPPTSIWDVNTGLIGARNEVLKATLPTLSTLPTLIPHRDRRSSLQARLAALNPGVLAADGRLQRPDGDVELAGEGEGFRVPPCVRCGGDRMKPHGAGEGALSV